MNINKMNASFNVSCVNNLSRAFEQVASTLQPFHATSLGNSSNLVNCTVKSSDNLVFSSSSSLYTTLAAVLTGVSLCSYFYTALTLLLSGELLNKRRYFSTFNYCLCLFINCIVNKMSLMYTGRQLCRTLHSLELFSLSASYAWIIIQGYFVYETVILTKHFSLLCITVIGYLTPIKISLVLHRYSPDTVYTECLTCALSEATQVASTWFFVILLAAAQIVLTSLLIYTLHRHWKDQLTETFYRNWTIISSYFTLTILLSTVDRYYYSTVWSSFVATTFQSLTGSLVFILEVLTNQQLLSTLSVTNYNSQTTLSSGEWFRDERVSSPTGSLVRISNEAKADESTLPRESADSTAVPFAHCNALRSPQEQYVYI